MIRSDENHLDQTTKQGGGAAAHLEEQGGGAAAHLEEQGGGAAAHLEEQGGGAAAADRSGNPNNLGEEITKNRHKLARIWGKSDAREYTPVDYAIPSCAFTVASGSGRYIALSGFPIPEPGQAQLQTDFGSHHYRSYMGIIKRLLGAEMYALLGGLDGGSFYVPKQHLAMLDPLHGQANSAPLTIALMKELNDKRKSEVMITKTLHLLSRLIRWIQPLANFAVGYFNDEDKKAEDQKPKMFLACLKEGRVPEYAMFDGKKLPILGLMELLAASRLLGDVDVLGYKAQHVGCVVESKDGQPIALRVIKLGAGKVFSWSDSNSLSNSWNSRYRGSYKLADKKDIQFGTSCRPVIAWGNLSPAQQLSFLTAMQKGYKALQDENLLDFMIRRGGAWSSVPHSGDPGVAFITPKIIQNLKVNWNTYMNDQLLLEVYGSLLTEDALASLRIEAMSCAPVIPRVPFNPKLFKAASITFKDARAEARMARAEAEDAARMARAEAESAADRAADAPSIL